VFEERGATLIPRHRLIELYCCWSFLKVLKDVVHLKLVGDGRPRQRPRDYVIQPTHGMGT
jgi:hypothetical protein